MNEQAGIPPSRLSPGDRVQMAGRSDVFVVIGIEDPALIRLRSERGAELRAGWRVLQWTQEGETT